MKILVMSDNHHDWDKVKKILAEESYDFSIHLGDAEQPESVVSSSFDKYVSGNHDLYAITEDFMEFDGIKFAILHGHLIGLGIFSRVKPVVKFGQIHEVNVVLHGHTHIPSDETMDGIRVICPGSISHPRSPHGATYMIITILDRKISSIELKKA